jgi:hypothetical protein
VGIVRRRSVCGPRSLLQASLIVRHLLELVLKFWFDSRYCMEIGGIPESIEIKLEKVYSLVKPVKTCQM